MAICTILFVLSVFVGGVIAIKRKCSSQKKAANRKTNLDEAQLVDMTLGKHVPFERWRSTKVTVNGAVVDHKLSDELFGEKESVLERATCEGIQATEEA